MTKHICFDWETIGNRPTAAVASVAFLVFDLDEVVPFKELVNRSIRVKFDWQHQLGAYQRTSDEEVVKWWSGAEQKEAFDKVIQYDGSEIQIHEFPQLLLKYMEQHGFDPQAKRSHIYTRGNNFDIPVFDDLYRQLGEPNPFPYWKPRDFRTAIDSYASLYDDNHEGRGYIEFEYPEGFIKHTETHDIARDVLMLQQAIVNTFSYFENLYKKPEIPTTFNIKDVDDDIPF